MSGLDGDRRLEILDSLVYADVFDCALTFDELRCYARVPVEPEALRELLRDAPAVAQLIVERDGLYCLRDRPELLDRRPPRMARALVLQRRARRVARVIGKLPFVRGVMLTGSAAAQDAGDDADVDLLIVVAPRRLGLTFLLLGSASRLLGRALFCPNYYVCEGHLGTTAGSLYFAREAQQARGLVGDGRALFDANPWLAEVFPNATAPAPVAELTSGGRLQRGLELPLRGRLGERLERWARGVAASRLEVHYGSLGHDVPEEVAADLEAGRSLRFHRGRVDEIALERHTARRAEVASLLAAAEAAAAIRS